jgi:hypothetical protein
MNEQHYIPPLAQEIVDTIGIDGFLRLVKRYGGITIRPGDQDLKNVLTTEQYKAFTHTYRNLKVYVPRLKAKQQAIIEAETNRLLSEGMTKTQVALMQGISERTVYTHQAKAKQHENDQQQDLFNV